MVKFLKGFTPYKEEDAEKYNSCRWWSGLTFGDILDRAADIHPEKGGICRPKGASYLWGGS